MSMIERVARAICDEVNDQPYDALTETATYMERKTHVYRPILDRQEGRQVARAAIEAMRTPTDAMIAEGNAHDECAPYDIYESMIDAALSE